MKKLRLVAALLFVLLPAGEAFAEPGPPEREESDPEPGEVVHHVHEVSVTFNEALDPTSSRLRVHACGKRVDSGVMQFSPTGETISVEVEESPPGRYEATYRVRGLDDTPEERMTPSEGSFSFALHYSRCEDDGGKGGHKHGNGGNGKNHEEGRHGGGHEGNGHTGGHAGSPGEHAGEHAGATGSHGDHTGGGHSDEHVTDHERRHDGSKKGHEKGKRARHGGKHEDRKHGGKHEDHGSRNGSGQAAAPRPEPSRPNNVINLILALGIPALVGALGGRALRARAVSPAR